MLYNHPSCFRKEDDPSAGGSSVSALSAYRPTMGEELWERGQARLANAGRLDKGSLPPNSVPLIEGLALPIHPPSAAAIHRQVIALAREQGKDCPKRG
jgi:hypothetical protein